MAGEGMAANQQHKQLRRRRLGAIRRAILGAVGVSCGWAGCSTEVVCVEADPGPVPWAGERESSESCDGAEVIPLLGGDDSGYVRCPDGAINRVREVACTPQSVCAESTRVECMNDGDCAADEICLCLGIARGGGPFAICVSKGAESACASGLDCASGECGLASALEDAAAEPSPELRAFRLRIAEDELRHAVLAWRALAWLIGNDASLAAVAQKALSACRAFASPTGVQEAVMREVVQPCLAGVVATASAPAA